VRWADFGSVLAEGVDQNYILVYVCSSIKLPRTAPLVLGVLGSDNYNSSFGRQQIKKLDIPFMFTIVTLP
jgi:hypothetical protein